ncbi:MAG: hypothetical protein IT384_32055 [Deltaproteobacteria bacterium]|nr:hypothetical protein [Deltaproteobacteria bacterium]
MTDERRRIEEQVVRGRQRPGAAAARALACWGLLSAVALAAALAACDSARRPGSSARPSGGDAGVADAGDAGHAGDAGGAGDASEVRTDAGADARADASNLDGSQGSPDAPSQVSDTGAVFADAGTPPTETTIAQIRAGQHSLGAPVIVRDVVVTAIHDEATRFDTLWVQDPRLGDRNAGIRVYVSGAHGATRDARVDVSGVVADYFGDAEIDDATVTLLGGTGAIAPVALTVSEAMQEDREGLLVRLTDVSSVNTTYSCSADNVACTDLRLWELNGPGGIIAYDFVYQDLDWDSRAGVTNVTGVMTWRYDRRRIMPRSAADLPF